MMVFLFNDVLLDLGDPRDCLINSGCPLNYNALQAMTPPQILSLVRSALFQAPHYPRDRRDRAAALAALVSIKTGANAMLCLRTPQVTETAQMPVRLGEVALRSSPTSSAARRMGC
jgi:hypothetical protein